jgi:hypothetical protein
MLNLLLTVITHCITETSQHSHKILDSYSSEDYIIVFWVMTVCSLEIVTYVLKQHTGSIFRVTTFQRIILPLHAGYAEDRCIMFCRNNGNLLSYYTVS